MNVCILKTVNANISKLKIWSGIPLVLRPRYVYLAQLQTSRNNQLKSEWRENSFNFRCTTDKIHNMLSSKTNTVAFQVE